MGSSVAAVSLCSPYSVKPCKLTCKEPGWCWVSKAQTVQTGWAARLHLHLNCTLCCVLSCVLCTRDCPQPKASRARLTLEPAGLLRCILILHSPRLRANPSLLLLNTTPRPRPRPSPRRHRPVLLAQVLVLDCPPFSHRGLHRRASSISSASPVSLLYWLHCYSSASASIRDPQFRDRDSPSESRVRALQQIPGSPRAGTPAYFVSTCASEPLPVEYSYQSRPYFVTATPRVKLHLVPDNLHRPFSSPPSFFHHCLLWWAIRKTPASQGLELLVFSQLCLIPTSYS